MFERQPTYEAYFLPGPEEGLATDEALTLGLRWLLNQPGRPLVVLSAKKVLNNNRLLSQTVTRAGVTVVAPPRMWHANWPGGSILAPWASEKALFGIDDELQAVAAVCVIGWSRGHHATWISGHAARDLRNPTATAPAPSVDPVVRIGMERASRSINHNNALVQDEDKAYVVRTLQELVRGGYGYSVEELVAWAIADGWYPAEIPNLRNYAQRVLDGRRFVLRDSWGPGPGACKEWAAEAARSASDS